ncbi:MAG: hypothetical protein KY459_14000 [Acidobacteria bacterium]|nr:hypothetical protein [Acidobacteriota bacterium]
MNYKTISSLFLVLIFVAVPASAQEDWIFGVRTGFYIDQGDAFLGVEGLTPISRSLVFNPNIEWVFAQGGDFGTINADVTYDLGNDGEKFWWVGVGIAGVYDNLNDSEFSVGGNILGGISWRINTWEPYAQVKVLISDAKDDVVAAVGLRF